ncbi:hypothetical protein NIES267_26810 [Calothrix parasitica NIES-267]|uniref:Transmembrane protein n=1 Tax=Calothrix parasitica NIES-267 TaxID=1973488 RepID=A0A1Z4LPU9_9CYAN|nr:hypothetical protein NIES267_26810 [Calothrix parasitica NIES-267]
MNYLIAVYPNRLQALSAFTTLEKESFSSEQISILGEGYKKIDDYGIIQSDLQGVNNIQGIAYWSVPCGFIAGCALIFLTNIEIVTAANFINWIIGGLLGAIFCLLSTFVIVSNTNSVVTNEDAWLYQKCLNSGKYLIFVSGTEELIKKATSILYSFDVEDVLK